MSRKKRSASERKRSAEWWAKLTPETRAKVKRDQAARNPNPIDVVHRIITDHHHRDDLACPACGTDSSVGCLEKESA